MPQASEFDRSYIFLHTRASSSSPPDGGKGAVFKSMAIMFLAETKFSAKIRWTDPLRQTAECPIHRFFRRKFQKLRRRVFESPRISAEHRRKKDENRPLDLRRCSAVRFSAELFSADCKMSPKSSGFPLLSMHFDTF